MREMAHLTLYKRSDIVTSPAGNLTITKEIAAMKVTLTEKQKEQERLRKRMDRFDSVVNEYLRATRFTVDELSLRVGCDPSTLWRYRRKPEYFLKAPMGIVSTCLRLANVSNEDLRIIMGLPTGRGNEDEN